MLVIDFDTEVAMNGLTDFLGNSTGRYAKETVAALKRIGCAEDAALLRQILSVASRAGMTQAAIQEDRQKLAPFAVSTFAEVHGTKWQRALNRIEPLSDQLDFDRIRRRAEEFVARHLGAVKEALARPSEAERRRNMAKLPHGARVVKREAFALPVIPTGIGVDPMVAAVVHCLAFFELSGEGAVELSAGNEASSHVGHYLDDLSSEQRRSFVEQLKKIVAYGKKTKWPPAALRFVRTLPEAFFLDDEDAG